MMKRVLSVILGIMMLSAAVCMFGCSDDNNLSPALAKYNESSYTIAVERDTIMETAVKKYFPKAKYRYVDNNTNGYADVVSGEADAYIGDKMTFKAALYSGQQGLTFIDEAIGSVGKAGVGVSPVSTIDNATQLINNFLAQLVTENILDDMYNRWVVNNNYTMPNIAEPTSPIMNIKIGTTGLEEPYTFYSGNELTGYDIELMKRFALYANSTITLTSTYTWDTVVPACASGDIDYIMSHLFDTEVRRQSIGFSNPYMTIETVLVVPE